MSGWLSPCPAGETVGPPAHAQVQPPCHWFPRRGHERRASAEGGVAAWSPARPRIRTNLRYALRATAQAEQLHPGAPGSGSATGEAPVAGPAATRRPGARGRGRGRGAKSPEQLRQEVSVVMIQLHKLEEGGARKLHHVLKKYAKCFGPDVALAAVWELVRRQDVERALEALEALRNAHWYSPDPLLYAALVRLLARHGRVRDAEALFRGMPAHGCPHTVSVFTALMGAYAHEGDVARAQALLEEMKHTPGCFPDVAAYSAAMRAHCRAGAVDEAGALLREMLSLGLAPDTCAYNVLLDGYARRGQAGPVKALYQQLIDEGLDPDLGTFNALLRGLARAGQVADMEAVFVAMQEVPFSLAPDAHSYRCLIEGYARGALHQKLLRTVQHMVLLRYRNIPAAWNTAVAALGEGLHIQDMERVFKLMKQQGVAPDTATFLALLQGYAAVAALLPSPQDGPQVLPRGSMPCAGTIDAETEGLTEWEGQETGRPLRPALPRASAIKGRVMALLKQMSAMGVPKDGEVYAESLHILASLGAAKEILEVTAAMTEDEAPGGGSRVASRSEGAGEGEEAMAQEKGRDEGRTAQGMPWQSTG